MKKIFKFVNEVSGEEFTTKKAAMRAELRSKDIVQAFNFYIKNKEKPKDGNDDIGIQRDEKFYNNLIDTLMKMVRKYEPWIVEHYKEKFIPEYIKGYSILGRFFDDGKSDLYHWWCIQGNICPKCYREYGQMYYALNCKCPSYK